MADTPTAAFSIRIRVRLVNRPGTLGRLAVAIGEAGGNIAALEGFEAKLSYLDEDIVVDCRSEDHQQQILAAIEGLDGIEVLGWDDRTFTMHQGGKIEVLPLAKVGDRDDLSMAYTPGVARVLQRDRRGAGPRPRPHDQEEHGRHRHRRHRRAGARRHRARGGAAGHGGQGAVVQGVRRRRRLPDLPRCAGAPTRSSRRSCAWHPSSVGSTSRTSPRRSASRSRSD